MKMIITALTVAALGVSLSAQAPSVDVLLARIAVLESENAQLRAAARSTVTIRAVAEESTPTQTLAGAAAAAGQVSHAWPASTYLAKGDPAAIAAAASGTPASSPEPSAPGNLAGASQGDALTWKTRMRTLHTQRTNDQTFRAAAVVRLATATADYDQTVGSRERAVAKLAVTDATTELSRLTAAVANDTRAIRDLELEAHRAGIPPGWLVLE